MGSMVLVSGGFNPLHVGHVRYLRDASRLAESLVVAINNDYWLSQIKGRKVFMPEEDRVEIIAAIGVVDYAFLTAHGPDRTEIDICEEIKLIKPDIFANGGDRFADNIPEFRLCQSLGIHMEFNVGEGGKMRSSSELLQKFVESK